MPPALAKGTHSDGAEGDRTARQMTRACDALSGVCPEQEPIVSGFVDGLGCIEGADGDLRKQAVEGCPDGDAPSKAVPAGLLRTDTHAFTAACPGMAPPDELAAAELNEAARGKDIRSGVSVVDSSPYLDGEHEAWSDTLQGLPRRVKPGRGDGVSRNSPVEANDAATLRLGVVLGVVLGHMKGAGELNSV